MDYSAPGVQKQKKIDRFALYPEKATRIHRS